MLEHAAVHRYALEHGLLPRAAIVDGDLVVRDRSSRHRTFTLERADGTGVVLKQGIGAAGAASIRREAAVYRRLSELGGAESLPRFEGYDEASGVLALGLVAGSEDLYAHHHRLGRFPVGPARALGRALGAIHRCTLAAESGPRPELAPSTLTAHRPDLAVFRDASAAMLAVIRILQASPALVRGLDRVRAGWRPRSVIHLDLKWDNCLLGRSPRRGAHRELRLIDWESAVFGDPCWDIGSALGQYLSAWVFSIPVTGATPPERFPELAAYPLTGMHPALRACWTAYADTLELTLQERAEWLPRAADFAAARLVQTAFEATQMAEVIDGGIALHLQLAANTFERPHEAATQLLGIAA